MKFLLVLLFSLSVFAQEEQLLVGLSGIDIKPAVGIPLAGYGSDKRRLPEFVDWRFRHSQSVLFRPSEGVHSPIRSKAMVLKKGKRTLVFLSLDMIGLEHAFMKDVAKRLKKYGIAEKDILASATHTHGGPGTLSRRLPLEVIAVDFFKRKNYQHVLDKVVTSVEAAMYAMVPADLYKSFAMIDGVQRNKFRRKDEEHYDKRANFLLAKSRVNNTWLGGLVNFAVHGGTMPIELLHYSSDVNGAIEKELELLFAHKNFFVGPQPTFLFMNGAEGDVATKGDRGVEMVDYHGKLFASESQEAFTEARLQKLEPEFSAEKHKVYLGLPGSSLRWCIGGIFKRVPARMKIGFFPLMPSHSYISQVRVGDVTMLSWPGEASTQLGYDLKDAALAAGESDPWVIGLANDYTTYFTTKSEFNEGAYDSCSSLYDYRGGDRIIKAHAKLLKKEL